MTRAVATALQKQLDALLADFTTRLVQLVREASLEDLVPRGAVAERAQRPAAPVSRAEPRRATKVPAEPSRRRSAAPPKPEAIEDALLRHLRSGVLLTLDELVAFGPSEKETRAAIDRLAGRGLVGFSGDEPDRFVFAQSGRPQPVAAPPVVAAAPPSEPVIEEPTPAPPVSTVTPVAPAAAAGTETRHPFVVRRKKAAT